MTLAAVALSLERLIPYPAALDRRIGHPVAWIGAEVEALERRWNRPERTADARRALGAPAVLAHVGVAAGSAALAGSVLGPLE